MPRGPLIERDAEVARCLTVIDRLRKTQGDALVIEAAAGVGKSSLLAVLIEAAASADVHVLAAAGSVLESTMPFGVVRRLFAAHVTALEPSVREEMLAGVVAPAAPIVTGSTGAASSDIHALVNALYWLTYRLATRAPVCLCIDDLQWCDSESLQFLGHLLTRAEGLPLGVVACVRIGEGVAEAPLIRDIRSAAVVDVISLSDLSEEGAARKIGERTNDQPSPGFVRACHVATRGNPFLLEELVDACLSEGMAPTDESAEHIDRAAVSHVSDMVLLRLARQSPAAVELARAVAILGTSANVQRAAKLSGLTVPEALPHLEALTAGQVFSPDPPLRFRHPLVQSSIYGDLPATSRAARHAEAARVLVDEHADVDLIAQHVLLAEPSGDLEFRTALESSGRNAAARGAFRQAARLFQRAIDEAPAMPSSDLFRQLGLVEATYDASAAVAALRRALDETVDDVARLAITSELAELLMLASDPVQATQLLAEAIDHLPTALDASYAARLVAQWGVAALSVGQPRDVVHERVLAVAADAPDGSLARALVSSALALSATDADKRRVWLAPAAAGAGHLARSGLLALAVPRLIDALCIDGDVISAGSLADEMLRIARESGSSLALAIAEFCVGHVHFFAGRLADAEAEVSSSLEQAVAGGWLMGRSMCASLLARVLIERSRAQDALVVIEDAPSGEGIAAIEMHTARARVLLALGRADEALAILGDLDTLLRPFGAINHLALYVSALASLARWDEAAAMAANFIVLARERGRALPVADALLAVAEAAPADVTRWEAAVEELGRTEFPLHQVRALLGLGTALRRANRKGGARPILERALDAAARCGAATLETKVRAELAAVGARPRRTAVSGVAALTPAELRTCRLAAGAMTNEQIAQALFVSVKTVETQLSVAYRKLGVRGRTQLAHALNESA